MTYTDVEVSVRGAVVVVVVGSPGGKGISEDKGPRAGDGLMVGRGWEGEKSVKAAL